VRIFPLLSELGIGVTAYGVLSRGLLSGSKPQSARDFRAHLPRFTGKNRERNQRLLEALQSLADEKKRTAQGITRRTSSDAHAGGDRSYRGSRACVLSLARATTNTRCGSSTASAERV